MPPLTTDEPQNPMRKGFLDLPYELRREVYCYYIPRRRQIDVKWVSISSVDYFQIMHKFLDADFNPIILRLSKQISEECLNILYGENTFRVSLKNGGERHLRDNFTEENRYRV